jgi:hypothetical protein
MKLGGFQKITLIIAIIILIVILIFIASALLSGRSNNAWPPIKSECPDWWISDGSGNKSMCVNRKNLGSCNSRKKKLQHFTIYRIEWVMCKIQMGNWV